jgi:hypothetical protein
MDISWRRRRCRRTLAEKEKEKKRKREFQTFEIYGEKLVGGLYMRMEFPCLESLTSTVWRYNCDSGQDISTSSLVDCASESNRAHVIV